MNIPQQSYLTEDLVRKKGPEYESCALLLRIENLMSCLLAVELEGLDTPLDAKEDWRMHARFEFEVQ